MLREPHQPRVKLNITAIDGFPPALSAAVCSFPLFCFFSAISCLSFVIHVWSCGNSCDESLILTCSIALQRINCRWRCCLVNERATPSSHRNSNNFHAKMSVIIEWKRTQHTTTENEGSPVNNWRMLRFCITMPTNNNTNKHQPKMVSLLWLNDTRARQKSWQQIYPTKYADIETFNTHCQCTIVLWRLTGFQFSVKPLEPQRIVQLFGCQSCMLYAIALCV